MHKYCVIFFVLASFAYFTSCKKSSHNPVPTSPATIDKKLLTGWWSSADKNVVQANIYFGTDNFYYSDTIKKGAPVAGFWRLSTDSIYYSAAINGSSSAHFVVSKLTSDSLVFSTLGTTRRFYKIDKPAITSPAITTIAGTGVGGYSGDGGLATAAQLYGQAGVIIDSQGNIYFCDRGNNVVRKISAADGKISTIAGTGKNYPFVNNIPATQANIVMPVFLAMDAAGNIYVSEATFGNRVDKISATDGKLTCIAGSVDGTQGFSGDGGLATSAVLYEPQGLAVDADGNVYIADLLNYRIRKVSASDGKIRTIAGTGNDAYNGDGGPALSADLSVWGISLDASGNIYFSDFAHNCIRKIAASTGIITTIAGTGVAGSSGDGGLATKALLNLPSGLKVATNGDIYFVEAGNLDVRKIDGGTGIITKVAGTGYSGYTGDGIHATGYSLNGPYGITTDATGNLYIGEAYRIRKVAAN